MDRAHQALRQDFHSEQRNKTRSASSNQNISSSHPLPLSMGCLAEVVVEGGVACPQVYDVPNCSGHVRELWPPRWCQGARLAGQPSGYLVRARSQQALSSMWKSLTAGHVPPPKPPLCKTAKLTFPGYRRPMNCPGNRLFIDSEESSCPCVTMITF